MFYLSGREGEAVCMLYESNAFMSDFFPLILPYSLLSTQHLPDRLFY